VHRSAERLSAGQGEAVRQRERAGSGFWAAPIAGHEAPRLPRPVGEPSDGPADPARSVVSGLARIPSVGGVGRHRHHDRPRGRHCRGRSSSRSHRSAIAAVLDRIKITLSDDSRVMAVSLQFAYQNLQQRVVCGERASSLLSGLIVGPAGSPSSHFRKADRHRRPRPTQLGATQRDFLSCVATFCQRRYAPRTMQLAYRNENRRAARARDVAG
jgi:hypothetical protein